MRICKCSKLIKISDLFLYCLSSNHETEVHLNPQLPQIELTDFLLSVPLFYS